MDWSRTPLGPAQAWPECLKTIVGVLMNSRHPMFLWWGDALIQFYNDAYLPSFGVGKHPAAMGQRGAECWQEIWPIIKPQIDAVMQRGEPSWNVDHLVPIARNGCIEEVYWTYGYSAVFTETGAVGGTLVVCTETTARILAERRLRTIRSLAMELLRASDARKMDDALMSTLAQAGRDVPFAAIYGTQRRVAQVGLNDATATQLDAALADQHLTTGRHRLMTPIAAGPWPEPVNEVLVLQLGGSLGRSIVFGLSPRLPFDQVYQSFIEQLLENLVVAQARARIDDERRNLLEKAPVATALLIGPNHVFEIANSRFCEMVGREVLGKTYAEAFPELATTEVSGILDRVYQGEPFVSPERLIRLRRDQGQLEDCYFRFNLEPVTNSEGQVAAMMAVAVEITEQVRARLVLERNDEERQRLLVAADGAARAKDEFLAMLGHELRNPLAPIVTALEVMKATGIDAFRREREIIARQATHLVRLVDDLLDASRLVQGKVELQLKQVGLMDVVRSGVEVVTPLIEHKRHELLVTVPEKDLTLYADSMRLSQVLANLLTNAARYTAPGGRIALTAARREQTLVIRVDDNGIGISAEQMPNLFTMFSQGPRRIDRSEGGLGLGLALVKSLVERHGGTVNASSGGPGLGSSFEVTLPMQRDPMTTGETTPASLTNPMQPRGDMRVLLVDDNRDLADVLATFLRESGCLVEVAYDGPSAMVLAKQFRPHVAVLDIGLPEMDGFELAARLREGLAGETPRMIAMTGYGQADDKARSQHAGFERHLVKPVDGKVLVQVLEELVATCKTIFHDFRQSR